MTKEDYKVLKRLVEKYPKYFTAESAKVDKETLIRFYHSNWLERWETNDGPAWRIEHKAKEALEEYEQELDATKDRKAGNRIALCALFISIAALLLSGTSLYLQYL